MIRPSLRLWLLALLLCSAAGCERSTDGLRPAPFPSDPVVFDDALGSGVDFQAFLGSKLDALAIDDVERHSGVASLRFTVPNPGDPAGTYAGGAFVAAIPRNLSGYDALTFWAKASRAISLDIAGLGNDNTGHSLYEAHRNAVAITTSWALYTIPIPRRDRLTREQGLFFLAEGPENNAGSTLWVDDVRFEQLGTVLNPRPAMTSRTYTSFVGGTLAPSGTQTVFNVAGTDITVGHMPAYFDFISSNPAVAAASDGIIRVTGAGSATITAQLGGVPATGTVTVSAIAPPPTPAPTPGVPAADVISLFSDQYANVPVDTWSASWDQADVTDLDIAGNHLKGYTNMVFAGIEFTSQTINATSMTHLHLDVFAPAGSLFRVKLVDFGANGVFGTDDVEQELSFNSGTTPAFTAGSWSSLEIPLSDFTALTTRAHLAQLVLSGTSTAFVDNVYLHR
jgi:hypothetical protein